MLCEKHFNDFKEFLSMNNYSERTLESYGAGVKQFLAFIVKYYPRINSLEKLTKDILLDYQKYLMNFKTKEGRHLSNTSQGSKLKAIKKFFQYLIRKDIVLKDPTTVIQMPKEEQRITRNILSQSEMVELLKSIKLNTPVNIRNRAIIELFYSCGMRTSELCDLKIQDINLKEQTLLVVKGKGNKSRLLPIGQYAAHYIQLYLDKSRMFMLKGRKEDLGYLFLSVRGNPLNKNSINTTVMQVVISNLKLDKHISCYSMRHSIASHLLANKVDITYIAQLLGHASLKTTQRYLKIDISDLKKMHSQYHPREIE